MGEPTSDADREDAELGRQMRASQRAYEGNRSNYASDREQALDQLRGSQQRADTAPWTENPFETGLLGMVADMNRQNQIDKLEAGGEPVFDSNGRVAGVFSNDGLFGGRVYSGTPVEGRPDTGWDPRSGDGNGGGSIAPYIDPLQAARDRRATAYANRNKALQDAFGVFNDDYYNDLQAAFRDVNSGGIQTAYDDALRGIYQGFKQQGVFNQGDFDAQVAALDAQKANESSRIDEAAKAYAEEQRAAVEAQRKKLSDSLSGILGGANNEQEINAQTDAVNAFTFDNDVSKLKAAGPTEASMEFFTGYNKVGAPSVTGAAPTNVAPISPAAFGGSALVQSSGSSGTSVASPFSGSSIKVV